MCFLSYPRKEGEMAIICLSKILDGQEIKFDVKTEMLFNAKLNMKKSEQLFFLSKQKAKLAASKLRHFWLPKALTPKSSNKVNEVNEDTNTQNPKKGLKQKDICAKRNKKGRRKEGALEQEENIITNAGGRKTGVVINGGGIHINLDVGNEKVIRPGRRFCIAGRHQKGWERESPANLRGAGLGGASSCKDFKWVRGTPSTT